MFEHVGTPQYETFFRTCHNLMKPDGVALIHTIGRMGGPSRTDAFTDKYIFPGGYIPALSEAITRSEKMKLIATDVENLRLHYAKTLRAWYQRCLDHKDEIVALFDERFFRMWTFYLSGAAAAFESASGPCSANRSSNSSKRCLSAAELACAIAELALPGRMSRLLSAQPVPLPCCRPCSCG